MGRRKLFASDLYAFCVGAIGMASFKLFTIAETTNCQLFVADNLVASLHSSLRQWGAEQVLCTHFIH